MSTKNERFGICLVDFRKPQVQINRGQTLSVYPDTTDVTKVLVTPHGTNSVFRIDKEFVMYTNDSITYPVNQIQWNFWNSKLTIKK